MRESADRRIMMTRKLLRDAFLKLLQEKPVHAISVKELCDAAGINRTTFYNHYGSPYDLLDDLSESFLASISERLADADPENRESVQERVGTVLSYILANRDLSVLLLRSNIHPDFAERLFALPRIRELFAASISGGVSEEERNDMVTFAIHGSYRLLQEWIAAEHPIAAEAEALRILSLARRVCFQPQEKDGIHEQP